MPTQLGRHFWPNFSFVSGLRVDYLSPTLYLTDILIGILFCYWLLSKLRIKKILNIGHYWQLGLFFMFLLVGIILSKNIGAGIYGLVKFFEFIFFGYYVAFNAKNLKMIASLFSIGVIFESLLAVFQFFNSGALGGWLYFLGERMFNAQTPGIAKAVLDGELILRPYGTFSHPNVLAGYLVIGMTLIVSSIKYQVLSIKKILFLSSLLIGTIALFLTMSRIAILLWIIVLMISFLNKLKKTTSREISSIFYLLFSIFIFSAILLSPLRLRFLEVDLKETSVTTRLTLMKSSILMFQDKPIFGVGLNNFIVNLPHYQKPNVNSIFEFLQPVHNIYLLILAETGLIGFGIFIWFIKKTIGHVKGPLLLILSLVLILGLFDHYWLTLQQGQLLFSLILGLCWIKNKPSF